MMQTKILLGSRVKIFLSLATVLFIPLFLRMDQMVKAFHVLDRFIAVPAIVLFAEIYYLEYANKTIDIVYCCKRSKTAVVLERFVLCLAAMLVFSVLAVCEFCAISPVILQSGSILEWGFKLAFSLVCTITFWGALTMTLTNVFQNYFIGVGISLLTFIVMYYVPFFSEERIISMFVFGQFGDLWIRCKLFYFGVSTVLLIVNNFVINTSPYKISSFERRKRI